MTRVRPSFVMFTVALSSEQKALTVIFLSIAGFSLLVAAAELSRGNPAGAGLATAAVWSVLGLLCRFFQRPTYMFAGAVFLAGSIAGAVYPIPRLFVSGQASAGAALHDVAFGLFGRWAPVVILAGMALWFFSLARRRREEPRS